LGEIICDGNPADLEVWREAVSGLRIFLRPVKSSDVPLLEEFFRSLSDQSMYQRFSSARTDMPHQRLQGFVSFNYCRDMVILAFLETNGEIIGLGQYCLDPVSGLAELALVVRDDFQNRGVGYEIQSHLTDIAKRRGVRGFMAEVMRSNHRALALLRKMGFEEVSQDEDTAEMELLFAETAPGKTNQ